MRRRIALPTPKVFASKKHFPAHGGQAVRKSRGARAIHAKRAAPKAFGPAANSQATRLRKHVRRSGGLVPGRAYINSLSLSGERVRRPDTHRAVAVRGDRPLGLGRSVAFRLARVWPYPGGHSLAAPQGEGTRVCEAQTKKSFNSLTALWRKPDILQWRSKLFFCLSRCLPLSHSQATRLR
jgi:hypothetical protein